MRVHTRACTPRGSQDGKEVLVDGISCEVRLHDIMGAYREPLRVHCARKRTNLAVAAPEPRQVLDWNNAGQRKCSKGGC